MKLACPAAMFAIGLIFGWSMNDVVAFFKIDTCLDGGGAWNDQAEVCRYR